MMVFAVIIGIFALKDNAHHISPHVQSEIDLLFAIARSYQLAQQDEVSLRIA